MDYYESLYAYVLCKSTLNNFRYYSKRHFYKFIRQRDWNSKKNCIFMARFGRANL